MKTIDKIRAALGHVDHPMTRARCQLCGDTWALTAHEDATFGPTFIHGSDWDGASCAGIAVRVPQR